MQAPDYTRIWRGQFHVLRGKSCPFMILSTFNVSILKSIIPTKIVENKNKSRFTSWEYLEVLS